MDTMKKLRPSIWFWIAALLFMLWNIFGAYCYGVIFWEKLADHNRAPAGDGMSLLPALLYVMTVKAMVSGTAGALFLMLRSHQAKFLFIGPLLPIALDLSPFGGTMALGPNGYWLPFVGTAIAVVEIIFCFYYQKIGVIVAEKDEV